MVSIPWIYWSWAINLLLLDPFSQENCNVGCVNSRNRICPTDFPWKVLRYKETIIHSFRVTSKLVKYHQVIFPKIYPETKQFRSEDHFRLEDDPFIFGVPKNAYSQRPRLRSFQILSPGSCGGQQPFCADRRGKGVFHGWWTSWPVGHWWFHRWKYWDSWKVWWCWDLTNIDKYEYIHIYECNIGICMYVRKNHQVGYGIFPCDTVYTYTYTYRKLDYQLTTLKL